MTSQQATSYEMKVYPLEGEFIASLEIPAQEAKPPTKIETVVILDRSGSMGKSVYKIVHSILPRFFEILNYDPETVVHVIAFESRTQHHRIKVGDMRSTKMFSAGGTSMAPAIETLQMLFNDFHASGVSSLRILTVSDGEVWDQAETKELGDKLAEFAAKTSVMVNSQAVRFFTSRAQPDTTALCSLLQLNNVVKSHLTDVGAEKHHEKVAQEMATLFNSDGLDALHMLNCSDAILYRFPWDEAPADSVVLLPARKNIFWLDEIPRPDQSLTINGHPVRVTVESDLSVDTFQLLLNAKLDFIVDRMKILKVVDTESARLTIEKIVEYFSRIEDKMARLLPNTELDPRVIENRARILKLNAVRSRKISTLLATIANDDHVAKLNAAQKAEYLRSVQASSKAGRGLAKRAAKKNMKRIGAPVFSFDEIVRKEILAMKAHFDEIKDIDYKTHEVSFYSHATTLEGIRSLIEFADDPLFATFDANELLQMLNLVGVACTGPVGDFPDASTWRMNELFVGCYVSVADIITSIEQSGDSGFVLLAPGIEKAITNVIPVFEDARVGVFLKKHAPSLLEFSASIGMRRVIADVPMTFGYTIIAGIRRLMYELNKSKTTAHVEAFAKFVRTAAGFVGKYYDHIESFVLQPKESVEHGGFYLANNGIGNMIVPLIRLYQKKIDQKVSIPAILRAIYASEIWRGISKEFRGKANFDSIVRDMLHKFLSLDIEGSKVKLQPPFTAEPAIESVVFNDAFTINKEYLEKLTQPLYYHKYMSLLPGFLKAAVAGNLEDIKTTPAMNDKSAVEAFGIDYSFSEFLFLNVFQALCYPRSNARADTKTATMKFIDVKHKNEVLEDVKTFVRREFRDLYEYEVRLKRRREEDLLAAELVDQMTKETSYERLIQLWREGVTRGAVTYKLSNASCVAFGLLLKRVVDLRDPKPLPLRADIIRLLLLAKDNDGNELYNGGQVADVKNLKKLRKRFLITSTVAEWDEIEAKMVQRGDHKYRKKANRHGHGREKLSYWAMGYANLFDYFIGLENEAMYAYANVHERCCATWHTHSMVWQKRWEIEEEEERKKQEAEEKERMKLLPTVKWLLTNMPGDLNIYRDKMPPVSCILQKMNFTDNDDVTAEAPSVGESADEKLLYALQCAIDLCLTESNREEALKECREEIVRVTSSTLDSDDEEEMKDLERMKLIFMKKEPYSYLFKFSKAEFLKCEGSETWPEGEIYSEDNEHGLNEMQFLHSCEALKHILKLSNASDEMIDKAALFMYNGYLRNAQMALNRGLKKLYEK